MLRIGVIVMVYIEIFLDSEGWGGLYKYLFGVLRCC